MEGICKMYFFCERDEKDICSSMEENCFKYRTIYILELWICCLKGRYFIVQEII